MAESSSWRHLMSQFKRIDKFHDKLSIEEIYALDGIGKQLLPAQYAPIAQTLHTILSRIDPYYVQENRAKGADNQEFQKSVSELRLQEADVEFLRSGSAKEQHLEEQIRDLVKQCEELAEELASEKDKNHWLNVEMSGLKQTSRANQRAMKCKSN